MVKHLRSSTHCSDTLEDCIRPQTACQTRWNSQLIMIKSVRAIPEPKLAEACANASRNIMLSANDHTKLNELVEILEPFRYVNDQLHAEKTVTSIV